MSDDGLSRDELAALVRSLRGRVAALERELAAHRGMQTRLDDSEERFRVTIQNSPIFVYNTDRELHHTWTAKPYPGSPLEALIEPQAHEWSGWEEPNPIISLEKRVLESGAGAREEISLPTTSGGQTWMLQWNLSGRKMGKLPA